jgi:hypothetical protein
VRPKSRNDSSLSVYDRAHPPLTERHQYLYTHIGNGLHIACAEGSLWREPETYQVRQTLALPNFIVGVALSLRLSFSRFSSVFPVLV